MNSFSRKYAIAGAIVAVTAMAGFVTASPAAATPFIVDAFANSSSGTGVGLPTISLTIGQNFSTSASATDLWSAGALPRWSNADGLIGNLFATDSDESGELAGTLIGANFGTHTQSGLTAPFGALVGEIGGVFVELGLAFSGPAWATGTLNLYYWDSNNFDNTEHITVDVATEAAGIPEPASLALFGAGLLGLGAVRRRKAKA